MAPNRLFGFNLSGIAMGSKHRVELTEDQRADLERLVSQGTAPARKIQHAHMLLLTDEGPHGPAWTDEKAALALSSSVSTIARARRRFVTEGLQAALRVIKDRPGRPPKIDGIAEAHLVALACSEPPEGHARWSIRLLTDRFVVLGTEEGWLAQSVGRETVRLALKKTSLSPGASASG